MVKCCDFKMFYLGKRANALWDFPFFFNAGVHPRTPKDDIVRRANHNGCRAQNASSSMTVFPCWSIIGNRLSACAENVLEGSQLHRVRILFISALFSPAPSSVRTMDEPEVGQNEDVSLLPPVHYAPMRPRRKCWMKNYDFRNKIKTDLKCWQMRGWRFQPFL